MTSSARMMVREVEAAWCVILVAEVWRKKKVKEQLGKRGEVEAVL